MQGAIQVLGFTFYFTLDRVKKSIKCQTTTLAAAVAASEAAH